MPAPDHAPSYSICARAVLEYRFCGQNSPLSVGDGAPGVAILSVALRFRVPSLRENALFRRVLREKFGVAAPVPPEGVVHWFPSVHGGFLQSALYYASTLCNTLQRAPQ